MIMQAQVQALQEEIQSLLAKLDESEARVDELEALLRDIKDRGPLGYEPGHEDLLARIDAALKDTP
jgi:prefoldin subunit 5